MMAQIRSIYDPDEWGWVESSATVSVASQTVFKLPGNQTAAWTANRRWRLKSGSSTRYGTVVSSSFTSETTITVTVDSGSLSASHSLAALSVVSADHVPRSYITSASVSAAISGFITSASVSTAISVAMPVGAVMPYAGASAPTGWLLCYGQAVSRTTYAALFAAISTTYGTGDGTTTFNLPDLRGRVVAGQDDMGGSSANRLTNQTGGLDGDTLGATGGAETHTLTTDQIAAHQHFVARDTSLSDGSPSLSNTQYVAQANSTGGSGTYNLQGTSSAADVGLSSSAGGGGAHNNVQPTIILNYIIKT
jgi:microcystin-dependent protein